jgi:hypothetical protein
VHTVERIELVDSAPGQRTISITQEKSKDSDQRERVYMRAKNSALGFDRDGNEVSSLVLSRCAPPAGTKETTDAIRFRTALQIICEHADERGILMRPLCEAMAAKLAPDPQSIDAAKKQADALRKWVETQARSGGMLVPYATRDGRGETAPWRFRDPLFASMALAAE